MSADRSDKGAWGLLAVGGVACLACCAGPILAFLAALSVGGALAFGGVAVAAAVAAVVVALAVVRRRRRAAGASCATPPGEVPVTLGRRVDARR